MASFCFKVNGLIAIFLFSVGSGLNADSYANCTKELIDKCLDTAKSHVMLMNMTFLLTKEDLDEECQSHKELFSCLEELGEKCPKSKQFLVGASEVLTDLCNEDTYSNKYLGFSPCFNGVFTNDSYCGVQFTNLVQSAADIYTSDEKEKVLHQMCSAVRQYTNCSRSTVQKVCGDDGGEFIEEYNFRVLGKIQNICEENIEPNATSSPAIPKRTPPPVQRPRTIKPPTYSSSSSQPGAGTSVLPNVITVFILSIVTLQGSLQFCK